MKKNNNYNRFTWEILGDIEKGRPNLGLFVHVAIYRLLLYTVKDALVEDLGVDRADEILIKAGRVAGFHFCENMLNKNLDFNPFIADLQKTLKDWKIGILRIENFDPESLEMTLTVAEDLDCSGLPYTDEVVCKYDEGFIAGVLEAYTGKIFRVKEIDCWAAGDRVCRFDVRLNKDSK